MLIKISPAVRALATILICFGIAACDSGDDTKPISPMPVGDTTAPTAPGSVTATASSATQINLSWSASTDAVGVTGYRIFRNGSTTALTTVTTTTYSDSTVVASTQYSYTVNAIDAAGNVSAPGGASATTPAATPTDTTPPTAPTNVTATLSGTQINLSWTASTDAVGVTGYRIFRNGSTTALTTVTPTTYSDTTVSAGTQYSYAVRAIDAAGNVSNPGTSNSVTTPGTAPMSGLDARPSNTTCVAWEKPSSGGTISTTRFTNLNFTQPIKMLQIPGNNTRWYIVQQNGVVRRFDNTGTPTAADVVNISGRIVAGGERGLLGMAFHPNFPTDRRVFLSYTASGGGQTHISSFVSTDGGATIDAASEIILLRVDQPESNHNGGNIAFGPDGFLYIGLGDGGGGGDQHGSIGNGQRLTTMLGKMLRIDVGSVEAATTYAIPSNNPFAGNAQCPATERTTGECPEIYAYGFRNPWRWSFDRANGELWVADVGQNSFEEVDFVQRGGNYGWRQCEGAHTYPNTANACNIPGLINPVAEYGRSLGVSTTGGYVYRGSQPTNLVGRFLFGDFASGNIWAVNPDTATTTRVPTLLVDTGFGISTFGEGNDGELYVVNYGSGGNDGTLNRINFTAPPAGGAVPATLSASGCVSGTDATQPAPGLIPYGINAPFWSDGAAKERFMALPNGTSVIVQASNDWDFPNDTVLVKNFRVNNRLIETRLFVRHSDASWSGASYEWNAGQTDATRVQGGATRDIGGGQTWIFPSESQCLECHTAAAGRALGLETAQLNRSFTYPQTGRTANELFTLNFINLLSPAITDVGAQPTMPDPADTAAPFTNRARAYLHTNCSQCHRPGGPTPSNMDLRYTTALNATNACNASPQEGDLGIGASARIIAPGSAANSVLVNRVNRRDANQMPPLGSNMVDTAGVTLLTAWINDLANCN